MTADRLMRWPSCLTMGISSSSPTNSGTCMMSVYIP
jgi:hypothetical protein